jgi:HAD superfamily hydrolase (TIGR01509 family)
MNTRTYDLVIFDCDGVLVDSEPLAGQVYGQLLEEQGYPVSSDPALYTFFGQSLVHRMEKSSQQLNWTPPATFVDMFNERLSALTVKELKTVPGIFSLLDSLSVPVCVASNGSRDEITLRLKVAGLTERFGNAIFSGTEVPHPKPAPDVFLTAAKSFDISPSRCVVVEDTVVGVTAGVRAGMKVYGYAGFNPPESLREAGAIPFRSMPELQKILGNGHIG